MSISAQPATLSAGRRRTRALSLGASVVAAASLAAAITAPSQAVAVPAAVAVPPNAAAVANPAANRIVTARIKATRVFVVGDSLTVGADPYIRQALGTSVRRVAINAQVGRFTSEGISLLSPQSPSRVWVVALGTNDGPDAAATRAWVARVMALAGKRQVIIMTIVRPGGYHVVNQAMIDMRRRYRNLQVADWATLIARNPSYLGRDGVHLTTSGYRLRGKVIAAAVRNSAARP
ncbi:MAG: hypothetical protein QG671_3179 [Actinomycetota bacterium]|nr:hypothetical protein [Actinomycetota bacterium]HQZ84152.1 hypothetical protein [Actinomycetota bacterium]